MISWDQMGWPGTDWQSQGTFTPLAFETKPLLTCVGQGRDVLGVFHLDFSIGVRRYLEDCGENAICPFAGVLPVDVNQRSNNF